MKRQAQSQCSIRGRSVKGLRSINILLIDRKLILDSTISRSRRERETAIGPRVRSARTSCRRAFLTHPRRCDLVSFNGERDKMGVILHVAQTPERTARTRIMRSRE